MGEREPLPPAVVLGGSTTALGVARSLSPLGIRVIALDSNKNSTCFFSSNCEARISPNPESWGAVEFLLGIASELGEKAVLFPTSDAWAWLLSRNAKKLRRNFLYDFIPEKKMEKIMNKAALYRIAENAGIAVPKTLPAGSAAEAGKNAAKLKYPVLVKPLDSARFFAEHYRKGFVAKGAREAERLAAKMQKLGYEAVLQEIVAGPESELFSFVSYRNAAGKFVEEFTFRKLRQQPPDFGTCALGESIKAEAIVKPSERLLQAVGYAGMSQVEYKRGADGKYYLMEINPRVWLWHSVSTRCGASISIAAYNTLTGKEYSGMRGFRENVKWWDAVQDWKTFRELNRQGRLGFREWLGSIRGEKDNVWFDSRDLMLPLRKGAHKIIYKIVGTRK